MTEWMFAAIPLTTQLSWTQWGDCVELLVECVFFMTRRPLQKPAMPFLNRCSSESHHFEISLVKLLVALKVYLCHFPNPVIEISSTSDFFNEVGTCAPLQPCVANTRTIVSREMGRGCQLFWAWFLCCPCMMFKYACGGLFCCGGKSKKQTKANDGAVAMNDTPNQQRGR